MAVCWFVVLETLVVFCSVAFAKKEATVDRFEALPWLFVALSAGLGAVSVLWNEHGRECFSWLLDLLPGSSLLLKELAAAGVVGLTTLAFVVAIPLLVASSTFFLSEKDTEGVVLG